MNKTVLCQILLKMLKQYLYIGFTLGLANRVQFSEARSENGCEKQLVLVCKRVRIWRSGRHTPRPPRIPMSTPPNLGRCFFVSETRDRDLLLADWKGVRSVSKKLDHKKGLDKKNITLHVYHAFWYISLRSSVTIASDGEALLFLIVLSSRICEDRVLSFLNTTQLTFINCLFCILAI